VKYVACKLFSASLALGFELRSEFLRRPTSTASDALILAAARASGAVELVTEDLNHGQNYGGIRVVNPFR
jgi:predicted nucleic acid-binding protein